MRILRLGQLLYISFMACLALPTHAQLHSQARSQTPDPTLAEANTFLRHLYHLYEDPPTELGPDILVKHPLQVYTPGLYALVRRDQRGHPGEVGNLDMDPICICQDNGGMKLPALQISRTGPQTAVAHVTLHFPEPLTITATLDLLWTHAGWRVDDVHSQDMPSLRQLLR